MEFLRPPALSVIACSALGLMCSGGSVRAADDSVSAAKAAVGRYPDRKRFGKGQPPHRRPPRTSSSSTSREMNRMTFRASTDST